MVRHMQAQSSTATQNHNEGVRLESGPGLSVECPQAPSPVVNRTEPRHNCSGSGAGVSTVFVASRLSDAATRARRPARQARRLPHYLNGDPERTSL